MTQETVDDLERIKRDLEENIRRYNNNAILSKCMYIKKDYNIFRITKLQVVLTITI